MSHPRHDYLSAGPGFLETAISELLPASRFETMSWAMAHWANRLGRGSPMAHAPTLPTSSGVPSINRHNVALATGLLHC